MQVGYQTSPPHVPDNDSEREVSIVDTTGEKNEMLTHPASSILSSPPPRIGKKKALTLLCVIFSLLILMWIISPLAKTKTKTKTKTETINQVQNATIDVQKVVYKSSNETGYLVTTTIIRNKRRYVREWLEFHLMVGFSYFFIYDHHSDDGLKAVLDPYIKEGKVIYTLWPPIEEPKEIWNDDELERDFRYQLGKCYEGKEREHLHVPCQVAATDESIRRSRINKVRWLASIDVDEFYYPSESSPGWKVSPSRPMPEILKGLEDFNWVKSLPILYATSGWISFPRREDDKINAQLVTKTHSHHMDYVPGEMVQVHSFLYYKSFVDPFAVVGNNIHAFYFNDTLHPAHEAVVTYPSGPESPPSPFYHNHYVWLSKMDNKVKATNNGNFYARYVEEWDRLVNKEEGSPIEYLIPRLERKIQESVQLKPPTDGHADDWDYTLASKHVYNNSESADLCVLLQHPTHIGLARHALSTIINYFYNVEPSLNYKLIVFGSDDSSPHLQKELERDFPVDAFVTKTSSWKDLCSAEYILLLQQDSFARWEDWPSELPVLKMGIELLANIEKAAIFLGDSNNSLSSWDEEETSFLDNNNTIKNPIRFRRNDGVRILNGTYLTKKDDADAVANLLAYEMCLHTIDHCENNQIRGLFEAYYQGRMYGYQPWIPLS